MYQRVASHVEAGKAYYPAVVAEHRSAQYPLRPFIVVRPPTLAWVTAAVSPAGAKILAQALVLIAAVGWVFACRQRHIEAVTVALAILAGGFLTFYHNQLYHELWAGLFLAIAASIYERTHPERAAVFVLIAIFFREHAAVFAAVFGGFAAFRRDRRGITVWLACGLLTAAFYGFHAHSVGALLQPGDRVSRAWAETPGLAWALRNSSGISLLRVAGAVGPYLVPLAIFGWLGNRRVGVEIFSFICIYTGLIALFARGENYYWAFLLHPLLLPGLAFLPRFLKEQVVVVHGCLKQSQARRWRQ